MNWFAWRQSRKALFIFVLVLLAAAAFIIPTGNHFWHAYQYDLTTCKITNSCDTIGDQLFSSGAASLVKNAVFAVGLFTPLLLGLFLGSPLFAREYEEGTNKLAWTQSVSRRKWLTVKLVWALGFALLFGIAVSLLTTWWSRTSNVLYDNRFAPGLFDIQSLMPVANALLLTAVGFTLGAWFRKTVLALGITIGVFITLQVVFASLIRPLYMAPVTVTSVMGPNAIDSKIPAGAWLLSRDIIDKNGKKIGDILPAAPPECQKIIQQANASNGHGGVRVKIAPSLNGGDPIDDCLNKAGFHQVAKYQPSYRYWDFQRIETGIYLGMTAVAVGATYWLVLRRDA